jgi:tripartite ATP-independent transporter DctP family solute receptor
MRNTMLILLIVALTVLAFAMPATAQTKFKFAHCMEVNEAYHTNALWAADEIAKRTNGKYQIDVFPASALGNEQQINQALTLGTIDIIYTGTSFIGATYKPMAISGAPFMFRDFEHWIAYTKSPVFVDLVNGAYNAIGHRVLSITYYGVRATTANKAIRIPTDMKGMKLRVPQAPMYLMFTKAVGANAVPIAFSEVYLALQNGTVDGQENPLPTIQAKKFYEVQSHINLTNHITSDLIAVMGGHAWNRLAPPEQKIFETIFNEMAKRSTSTIRSSELSLVEWFKQHGKTVVTPDIQAFREVAARFHNDPSAGAVWTKELYDRVQAVK